MARAKKQIQVDFENYEIVCRGLLAQVMKTLWGPVAKRVLRAVILLMEAEQSCKTHKIRDKLFPVLSGIINEELQDEERARLLNYMRVNKHLQDKPKTADHRQIDLFSDATNPAPASAWDKALDRISEQNAEDFD